MTYLKNLIFSIVNTEHPTSGDYIIAKYLLEHLGNLHTLSATQLAKECNVSKATVSRFVRKLGLDDFMDLLYLCRYSLNADDTKFQFKGEQKDLTGGYLDAVEKNVRRLKTVIRQEQIERLEEDLEQYSKVAAFGHMQSAGHAMSLQCDLSSCGKYIDFYQQTRLQQDYLKHADQETLIIIFSVSGSFLHRLNAGRTMTWPPGKKPKIYLITTEKIKNGRSVYDEIIELDQEYDYASANVTLSLYEQIIALHYYRRHQRQND